MYGEWLAAKHTVFYDSLPHYFMEFDVLDTETGDFLDTARRRELLAACPVVPVKVLTDGLPFKSLKALESLIVRSYFITNDRFSHLVDAALGAGVLPADAVKHTDMDEKMEGLYVKWEEAGIVKGRYKYVRQSFTNSIIDQEEHWHDRPIIQNRLREGALLEMY